MGFTDMFRKWFFLEKKKESVETLAQRIADQIRVYDATKTELEKESGQEEKLEHGLLQATEVEIREVEVLINDIKELHSRELEGDARKLLENLREQHALFLKVENIIRNHHEDTASLPHLVHEEIIKSRDAQYLLKKDERKVA